MKATRRDSNKRVQNRKLPWLWALAIPMACGFGGFVTVYDGSLPSIVLSGLGVLTGSWVIWAAFQMARTSVREVIIDERAARLLFGSGSVTIPGGAITNVRSHERVSTGVSGSVSATWLVTATTTSGATLTLWDGSKSDAETVAGWLRDCKGSQQPCIFEPTRRHAPAGRSPGALVALAWAVGVPLMLWGEWGAMIMTGLLGSAVAYFAVRRLREVSVPPERPAGQLAMNIYGDTFAGGTQVFLHGMSQSSRLNWCAAADGSQPTRSRISDPKLSPPKQTQQVRAPSFTGELSPVARRVLILGNSGSGKSTLAKYLAQRDDLKHIDLDLYAWQSTTPPQRQSVEASLQQIYEVLPEDGWVAEGCYADLIDGLKDRADLLIFLNIGVEACIQHCQARPFEPHKYESPQAQQANLNMLIEWVRGYDTREGPMSLVGHRVVFGAFPGDKLEITEPPTLGS